MAKYLQSIYPGRQEFGCWPIWRCLSSIRASNS